MPYCTSADVQAIIHSTLTTDQITGLIVLADAEIDARGMSTRAVGVKKAISMIKTAALIAGRDPKSWALGEYKESVRTPKEWNKLAENYVHRTGPSPDIIVVETLPWE